MLHTMMRYLIYDVALNLFFDQIKENFPKTKVRPVIGDTYSKVIDHESNEIFYNCKLIPLNKLSYYDELPLPDDNVSSIKDYAFAMEYTRYSDLDDDPPYIEEYDLYEDICFLKSEISSLTFYK